MRRKIPVLFPILVLLLSFSFTVDAQSVKLKITKKPAPKARDCSGQAGTAILRVTFGAQGSVTDVEIKESSGCNSFDKSAMKAARRIEFEPEMRDGEAVAVSKTVIYKYRKF